MLDSQKPDEAAAEDKPLKRPANPLTHMKGESEGINMPAIMLDYEKHGQGMINRKDLEIDNVCKYKQGFIGLVVGKPIAADDASKDCF